MSAYRGDCRYCQRYSRACGRQHTLTTRPDWSRDWSGDTPANEGLARGRTTVATLNEWTDGMV